MSIRTPLTAKLAVVDTATTGTITYPFYLDQDVDGVAVSLFGTTFSGTSYPSADVYLQTTPDGGTTWIDVAHFAQMTTGIAATASLWAFVGINTNSYAGARHDGGLSAGAVWGALLSTYNRVKIVYGGTIGSNSGLTISVYENSQSSHQ
jgi:hypothetical protein